MEEVYYKAGTQNICVTIENQEVTKIFFVDEIQENPASLSPLMQKVIQQIDEYFQAKRREFSFPIRLKGTDFQVKIWKLLSRIPYGTSLAYVKVAQEYGDAKMVISHRQKPHTDCSSLSSGDWERWISGGLFWRLGDQTPTSRIRGFS